MRVWQQAGVGIDPAAPIRVTLILRDGFIANRLQIASTVRGTLRDEPRPAWGMEQLCEDALQMAMPEAQREQAIPAAPIYPAGPGSAPAEAVAPAGAAPPALLPPVAGAPPAVSELGARGQGSYARGDYSGALTAFTQAAKMSGDPNRSFDVGVTHYAMKATHARRCRTSRFISDRAPSAANREQTQSLIALLHAQLGDP